VYGQQNPHSLGVRARWPSPGAVQPPPAAEPAETSPPLSPLTSGARTWMRGPSTALGLALVVTVFTAALVAIALVGLLWVTVTDQLG
jgi:hypothetical protein